MSYSSEVLISLTTSDGATMIGDLPKLKKEAKLNFRCQCGKEAVKTFVRAKISGLLCKDCTEVRKRKKTCSTNLEKYGNICTLQNESIIKKAKASNLKRFGYENPFMSKEIQQQIKQTNKEKYGTENPYSSPIIIKRIRNTCKEKYGTEFPMQVPEIQRKARETNLVKYGVEVGSKAESIKEKVKEKNMILYGQTHHIIPVVIEKIKESNRIKYGVEYSFQAESVKEKIKETLMERYGVEHNMKSPIIKEKAYQTNKERYGVRYPQQSAVIRAKSIATNILRYGVENPNQSPTVQAKSQKNGQKYKKYITPSGIYRNIQGYEHFALDMLFKTYTEEDIHTDRSSVPRICYDNNTRYYFPDIWIESENKIIEVKSDWTYKLHKESNILKREATIKAGYLFEFWVFDKLGNLTII